MPELAPEQERELRAVRRCIQAHCARYDEVMGYLSGYANRRVWGEFQKSRSQMSLAELRRCLDWARSHLQLSDPPQLEEMAVATNRRGEQHFGLWDPG